MRTKRDSILRHMILDDDMRIEYLKRRKGAMTEIVHVDVKGWNPSFEDSIMYVPETVDVVKERVANTALEFETDTSGMVEIPNGITHLSVVHTAGRVFLRKEYTEREAWKCEAYCKLQATAALNDDVCTKSVTPLAFGLSHEDVSDSKYSGIYTELVPDTQDVYTIMLKTTLGEIDRDMLESALDSNSIVRLATMDVLTGNYRHGGNILIHRPSGRVIGIDHDFAFSGSPDGESEFELWGRVDGPLVGRTMALRWSFRM